MSANLFREDVTVDLNLNVLKISNKAKPYAEEVEQAFVDIIHPNITRILNKREDKNNNCTFYALDNNYITLQDFITLRMVSNEMSNRYKDILTIVRQLVKVVSFLGQRGIDCMGFNPGNIFIEEPSFLIKFCPYVRFSMPDEREWENFGSKKCDNVDLAKTIYNLLSGKCFEKKIMQLLTFNDQYHISRLAVLKILDSILIKRHSLALSNFKSYFIYWDNDKFMKFIIDVHTFMMITGKKICLEMLLSHGLGD